MDEEREQRNEGHKKEKSVKSDLACPIGPTPYVGLGF